MPSGRFRIVRALSASALIVTFAVPQSIAAEVTDHLVSPSDLEKAAVDASQARERNLESLQSFFGSDPARRALESAHMNPQQVNRAIATLSDEELAQLASRARKAQANFAAGTLSDRDLLVILVAIAALILIIVAVR